MRSMTDTTSRRILIIDDNRSIHQDFRKIFESSSDQESELAASEAALFGETATQPHLPTFRIDSAYQGQEGLTLVRRALDEKAPYALAFVDIRMPPGLDGVETAAKLWDLDPEVQIVICTAYSDYSWEQMLERLGHTDRLVILKKPFDNIEVLQLANALTEKWRLSQQAKCHLEDLERIVAARTHDLQTTNAQLIGMTEVLLATPVTPEQRNYLTMVRDSADTLLAVVNGILDSSKIEAGHMELEQDLAELSAEAP